MLWAMDFFSLEEEKKKAFYLFIYFHADRPFLLPVGVGGGGPRDRSPRWHLIRKFHTGWLRFCFWDKLQLHQGLNLGSVSWAFGMSDTILGLWFFTLTISCRFQSVGPDDFEPITQNLSIFQGPHVPLMPSLGTPPLSVEVTTGQKCFLLPESSVDFRACL